MDPSEDISSAAATIDGLLPTTTIPAVVVPITHPNDWNALRLDTTKDDEDEEEDSECNGSNNGFSCGDEGAKACDIATLVATTNKTIFHNEEFLGLCNMFTFLSCVFIHLANSNTFVFLWLRLFLLLLVVVAVGVVGNRYSSTIQWCQFVVFVFLSVRIRFAVLVVS
jgi:hypothetical protein